MAYNNNQNESALPTPNSKKKKSIDFLPKFFRTEANRKFLQGTLDQLISDGAAEKVDGYVGRKYTSSYKSTDSYIPEISNDRENYQLEPSVVIRDNLENVDFLKDYKDYINILRYFGADTNNHNSLNTVDTYSWTPHINWDTFTNFRDYYWLPNGPMSVPVRGQSRDITSTYTVTLEDQGDNVAYVFNDGFTRNPKLKLYRGQTYRFEIDTPGHPLAFSISRTFIPGLALLVAGREGIRSDGLYGADLYGNEYDIGDFIITPDAGSVTFEADENVSTLYNDGITKFNEDGDEVAVVYVEKGTIEFTIPANAPDRLFYISQNDVNTSGQIRVFDVEENTFLNIDTDILGKKYYQSSNGVDFTNGLLVRFQGTVVPEKYNEGNWYVEGVGENIKLISQRELVIPSAYTDNIQVPFDSEEFDVSPFATANNYPLEKDYLIINRASQDKNPWTRNNRWFHKDVILKSFEYNNIAENLDDNFRAKRPIIEFNAGLKLFNYGTFAKQDVDLLDNFTTDVFSTIQGSQGYIIDGVELAQGMRVLFRADTDQLVSGKIYEVKFITIGTERIINLVETADSTPLDLENVFVKLGEVYSGKTFHYHENMWIAAQEKLAVNQPPLFDLCCPQGNEYSNTTIFESSTFSGTKIFSYKEGTGTVDNELGFALQYRNIENTGDILFEFNLLTDVFSYQNDEDLIEVPTSTSNLRKYSDRTTFKYVNGWNSTPSRFTQYVIRDIEVTDNLTNNFAVDVYNKPHLLEDLKIKVYVNNKLQLKNTDYNIVKTENKVLVSFVNDLTIGDYLKLKLHSSADKNQNGYYELPISLERNPLNEDINQFTLGEVYDHVDSMIEDLQSFTGTYPGTSNLRDLGNISQFGKRFVKHEAGLANAIYHLTNKKYNLIKAVEYSTLEYNKAKKILVDTASSLGFDGTPKAHVDKILKEINKDKADSQPFYFSDMLAYGDANRIEYNVIDKEINLFPLTTAFSMSTLSEKAITVYLNNKILVHGRDYNFNEDGFIEIIAAKENGDTIEIYEYNNTDGSFIAPTPSKLGLYPSWYPEVFIDDTGIDETSLTISGPFKIYGEVEVGQLKNSFGWTYPVYTSKNAAETADSNNGGNGASQAVWFKGLNTKFYLPETNANYSKDSNPEDYDEYPIGVAFIRGHDGSQVACYKDFRDSLIIEFEKRIFSNIKISYDDNEFDIFNFTGGDFRGYQNTLEKQNNLLLTDFTRWQANIAADYSSNSFYDRNNGFTFNYSESNNPDGKALPGFWRGIYNQAFDTDRPHTNPWEMLGFRNKPTWWNDVYGPAPYTSNNLVLWEDLENGRIADPNNSRIDERFKRPNLRSFIPVDQTGKLLPPVNINYVKGFVQRYASKSYSFGDYSPIETAWRKSSDYPFALLKSMLLINPAETIAKGFDLSRFTKNLAGQNTYKDSGTFFRNKDIVFPNTYADNIRNTTCGLVNYIYNLLASDILTVYSDYQNEVTALETNLSFRLGGFSDKQKLNLILESKSPNQDKGSTGIFVPQENYNLVYNVSSPIDNFVYSGVVIEKTPAGFKVTGYNPKIPFFQYYKPLVGSTSYILSVGGISEQFSEWSEQTPYKKGQVVFHLNTYYRATQDFTSGGIFETDFLAKLPALPSIGGRTAEFYKNFNNNKVEKLPYGSILTSIQEVVDFLTGYGNYLTTQGFVFDDVTDETVNDWVSVTKEFMFWTTQGWANGTIISLSPAANKLFFKSNYSVVDDVFDSFYNTSIVSSNGQTLDRNFNSVVREDNSFGLEIKDTDFGLYGASLPIVQKEHVVVLSNTTIFNDVIYHPASGYRQQRIKVNGYRSEDWNGGLNIPGFLYDNAIVKDFENYKDYKIGDLIKFKEYYYVAKENIQGSTSVDYNQWYKLNEKPVPDLLTNFDYRINQFNDFYDTNTSSFDQSLHNLASRLIGFQKRDYLSNLIVDDVSQLKFYKGYIQEKGTKNSLSKLFAPLTASGEESLEYFEEWAIRSGIYGSSESIQQIELNLEEKKMISSPQPVEFVDNLPAEQFDNIFRVLPSDLLDRPQEYTSSVFPVLSQSKEYIKSSGYVSEDDIDFESYTIDDLALGNVNVFRLGGYLHLTNQENENWTVYQHIDTNLNVTELTEANTLNDAGELIYELSMDKWLDNTLSIGDLIAIRGAQEFELNGFYKIVDINLNIAKIKVPIENDISGFLEQSFAVSKLREVRLDDTTNLNDIVNEKLYNEQKVWIDNYDNTNNWAVLKNNSVYSYLETYNNPSDWDSTIQNFTGVMTVTDDNNNLFVSASGDETGKIYVYRRSKENANLILQQVIDFTETKNSYQDSFENFGSSIDVSEDGEYLAIGIPNMSGIKTKFLGNFDPTVEYSKHDIVKFRESFWKANTTVNPEVGTQTFSTFDSYINLVSSDTSDSTSLQLLVAGKFGLPTNGIDHLLVRAPLDMYLATKGRIDGASGDKVNLSWNQRSYAYPTLDNYLPFDDQIPEITKEFITQEHEIVEKIDAIVYIDTFVSLPEVGDTIESDTGSGEVFYVASYRDSAVLYLKNINGIFNVTDEIFVQSTGNFIGFYTQESTYSTSPDIGGFWYIETGFEYANNGRYLDIGRGLVYADVRPAENDDADRPFVYYNIQDTVGNIGEFVLEKNRVSYISNLSYDGDSGPELSNLWVVRVGKSFQDYLTSISAFDSQGSADNKTLQFTFFDSENTGINLESTGFDLDQMNGSQQIYDIWDGYIDFEFTEFDFLGNPYEPVVGDIIEDVQIPRDGSGGLALTSTSTSTAEVVFYKKQFNSVRVYLKVLSGSWNQLNNIGRFQVRRKANEDARGPGDVDRVMGTIDDPNNDIVLGTNLVGDLLVFQKDTPFDVVSTPEIFDGEYYFYDETIEGGISIPASPPYNLNKNWTQVYNIPADERGTSSGLDNEGAVVIYRRQPNAVYEFDYMLTSQYKFANRQFGDEVKIRKQGNTYVLLVGSKGDLDPTTRSDPGSIEIFVTGPETTDVFKKDYQATSYNEGDVVIYKDKYYRANKDTDDSSQLNILDPIVWTNISWRYGVDDNYRGEWDNSFPYEINSIVLKDNSFYVAKTNIATGTEFSDTYWEVTDNNFDYLGYLPNLTNNAFFNEDVFDPATNIIEFSENFDVSKNGEVLVVTVKLESTDSTSNKRLAIYRKENNKYKLYQTISAPISGYDLKDHDLDKFLKDGDGWIYTDSEGNIVTSETGSRTQNLDATPDLYIDRTNWAQSVVIKPDGRQIAVSVPSDDSRKYGQGAVLIYTQVNGEFELSQTIYSPADEVAENFGYQIAFTNENLAVTSLNGDQTIPTTFDNQSTTFDLEFTAFRNIKIDSGVIYVYENLNNSYTYSEKFRFDNATVEFGKRLLAKDNHVYVGMPFYNSNDSKGMFVDYRKPKTKLAWNLYKEIVNPVNLDLIEGAFVYNKTTNRIVSYIDYIDPIQGKIAGPAEQEITFKTQTDPAFYNVGTTSDREYDPNQTWFDEHVGQVWWNISTARFKYPYQGNIFEQKNNWSVLTEGASINVYEWIESDYLPSQWSNLADTEEGIKLGISGQSLYGDTKYSTKLIYDEVSQIFSTKYYYWVESKRTVPDIENRNLSIFEIVNLIERPRENGYRYISFLGADRIVLNNFENILSGDDLVLNIKYKPQATKDSNLHKEFKLIADGDANSKLDVDIERKWFDSLIGFDTNNRPVPDIKLPETQKYGILNMPRQSMFVNRIEALKQTIERINIIFKDLLIVDDYNTARLFETDLAPTLISSKYDLSVDTVEELQYVSTNNLSPAKLIPIISNGELVRVEIESPGRGYKTVPTININGSGVDAEIKLQINNLGSVISAEVTNTGKNYTNQTTISVRRFSVLVNADSTAKNLWSIYGYNEIDKTWFRTSTQGYDVPKYWNYIDWYAPGYNQFTKINYEIDESYELQELEPEFNSIIKIKSIGSSGWLLLKRIGTTDNEDYTVDYETIGRENGTIQFTSNLYNIQQSTVGYDNRSFDSTLYDTNPAKELRIIFEALRDDIFINELAVEYNQLFLSSLRYVVAEQPLLDWAFKTSFIKINHKLGELDQPATFKKDSLEYFENYVKEVKPYKTNIREFVASYDKTDPTNSVVTDFDAAPFYNTTTNQIETIKTTVFDGALLQVDNILQEYPRKYFADNLGAELSEIKIKNPGSGYIFPPKVIIEDSSNSGATAEAFIGYGKVTAIKVRNPGGRFITPPKITLEGAQTEDGTPATAFAILGKSLVRTPSIKVKFDRVSGEYFIEDLAVSETFTASGVDTIFDLKWPIDVRKNKIKVFVDDQEMLKSTYQVSNREIIDQYTKNKGRLTFNNAPTGNSVIRIEYYKPLEFLEAADRIKFAYNPTDNMFGKELNQLMTGIDYGGVEVKSFDFGGPSGWDSQPWFTDAWDVYENTFEDEVFVSDGSTIAVELRAPLEEGIVYNLYKNGVRIDDPNYGTEDQTNAYAIVNSITGDGTTTIIETSNLGINLNDGDIFIVRKITSDGSITPDLASYDTALEGGDLAYTTAAGINAEEIITDGDLFVSTSRAKTEELVPGSMFDTLDIKVYTKESGNQGLIICNNIETDITGTFTYNFGLLPGSKDSILVKYDGNVLSKDQYTIDWPNKQLSLEVESNKQLSIILQEQSTSTSVMYSDEITVEETEQYDFVIDYTWDDSLSLSVTVNGELQNITVFDYSTEVAGDNRTAFRLENAATQGQIINYTIFSNNETVDFSQVLTDEFTANGITQTYALSSAPFYSLPTEHNIIVRVDQNILNSGYSRNFTIPESNQREYQLELFQQPAGSLSAEGLKVFLNGEEIFTPEQWRLDIANSSVILGDEYGLPGDNIEIYNISESEYSISGNEVILKDLPGVNSKVYVYQFSNHNLKDIEKIQYDVVKRETLINDEETNTYNRLTAGEILLRKPALDAQYVWITKNSELLIPSVDYYVTDNRTKIQLVEVPAANDVIEVIHFAAEISQDGFSYRQFKDILNRTHFKRLDASTAKLAQPLNYYDLRIEVDNGIDLPVPDKGKNMPGIIFINGERIEYFVKEDNTLRQIRRGTLGTGVPTVHNLGTKVYNQNIEKTVPYKDQNLVANITADGIVSTFNIGYNIESINEIEVFAAGKRLRKNSISVFDPTIDIDSPNGDITIEAEFSVDVDNNSITLLNTPTENSRITIIKKQGQSWTKEEETLGDAQNSIARFLRAGTYEHPE